jgi:TIR domain/CHAT domain
MGRLLADHRPLRLVVLNSCEGARGSARDIFSSTSATLVRRGIPAVLAMQYEITDRAAIEFSRAFYDALADGLPVDTSVSEARKAISLGMENTVEWGAPVLYMHSPDGNLFDLIQKPAIVKVPSTNVLIPRKAVEIFYCYAHNDERLKKKLEIHLSLLKQEGLINGWYDREIRAGTEWSSEIEAHLNSAHIILLLVSPDFMASDYCYSIEMKRALERHDAQDARVIPIILRPTDWERAPFSKLQVLPADRKPVTRWSDRDAALLHVAQDIRKVVDELNAKLPVSASYQHSVSSTTGSGTIQQGEQASTSDKWLAMPEHTILHPIPDSAFLFNQPLPDPGEFYGRVRERETLLNRTRNGASTSIVGPRRVGKTWLMSYLKLVARKELGTRYLVGYLDATSARCATVIGFTTSAVEALSVERRIFSDAEEGFAFLEQIVQELTLKNHVPILCIDEFEGFGNRHAFDLHFFTALRAMTQNGLCLIVASKIPLIDFISDYGKTSGFFNVFEQLKVRPFSSKEAERFVQSKGTQVGLTEYERKRLLQYGQQDEDYWPIRLQLVGKMLLEDKTLAGREQDPDYYRPEDLDYWQDFERRLQETYGGVMR